MGAFETIEDLLDFAIERELDAYVSYLELADKVNDQALSELLFLLAQEEQEHKERLELEVMKLGKVVKKHNDISELTVSDYVLEMEEEKKLDLEHVLLYAIQKLSLIHI